VRYPPRGVAKSEVAARDFYDLWLPLLAPSAQLIRQARDGAIPWVSFARRYRAEMAKPEAKQLIALLAHLSHTSDFSVGCYCADAAQCHRSLLSDLLHAAGAKLAPD
jgi:uncharacterized protein YeaO (DUF488 family)